MKKLLIAILLLAGVQTGYSQSSVAKKIADSDAEIQNPKKQAKPKTWIERGDIMVEAAEAPISNIVAGGATLETINKLFLKDQKPESTETIKSPDNETYTVQTYADKKLFFNNAGQLALMLPTKSDVENPLGKAYEAYAKASELGGDKKTLSQKMETVGSIYQRNGFSQYVLGDYSNAVENFKGSVKCNESVGKVDTLGLYNVGFAALRGKDYKTAEEYYNKAASNGYIKDGEIYGSIYESILGQGDTVRATQSLMDGYKKYPTNLTILSNLINHYLKAKEDPKVILPIIHDAQKGAPNNASLYSVEGNLLMQLDDEASAMTAYNKAIEIDPKNAYTYYQIGTVYYNKAAAMQNEAIKIDDQKQYEEGMAKAKDMFRKSIEPFEKAYELNANEPAFAEALKSVYFRFREDSPEMQAKYEKFDAITKSGK